MKESIWFSKNTRKYSRLFSMVILFSLMSCEPNHPPEESNDNRHPNGSESDLFDSASISFGEKANFITYENVSDNGVAPAAKEISMPSLFITNVLKIPKSVGQPAFSIVLKWKETHSTIENTTIEIRLGAKENRLEEWQSLPIDREIYDKADSAYYSNILFLQKDYSFYQLKFNSNLDKVGQIPESFSVFFIHKLPEEARAKSSLSENQLAGSLPCLINSYVSRAQWDCPKPDGLPLSPGTDVTHLVVHHSESNTPANGDWKQAVRSIWIDHTQITHKWKDIAYNWLIDPNGNLYEGRAGSQGGKVDIIGAHMCSRNGHTMGVCVLGKYMTSDISKSAKRRLIGHLAWKAHMLKIDPVGSATHSGNLLPRIIGHRQGCDQGYTDCPGNRLFAGLNLIRIAVADSIKKCK